MSQLETPNFEEMDIGKLRQYASHMQVPLAKTATKDEIIKVILRKLSGRSTATIADEASTVKPGYSKIKVMSDPTPGASNLPVYVNCNGYTCLIPRDVEVIVPERVVRTLNDATSQRRKQQLVTDKDGREVFKEITVTAVSYPFQVLEKNPGEEVLTALEISNQKTNGPRIRYAKMFGHWPTPAQLTRAIEQKLISLEEEETLDPGDEKLLSNPSIL